MSKYKIEDYDHNITITLICPQCESDNLRLENQYEDGDEYECISCGLIFKTTEDYVDYLIQEELDRQGWVDSVELSTKSLHEEQEKKELKPLLTKKEKE